MTTTDPAEKAAIDYLGQCPLPNCERSYQRDIDELAALIRHRYAAETAAWNSYARLAARIGCDPLRLAEADVLNRAVEACQKLTAWAGIARGGSAPPIEAIGLAMSVCEKITQCRQTEAQP